MQTSNFPPYLGSIDEVLNWLFHHPGAGAVDTTGLVPWRTHYAPPGPGPLGNINPQPLPPSAEELVRSTARYLAGLAALQQLAKSFRDPDVGRKLAADVDAAIGRFVDEYCGTAGFSFHFGWPYPGPWVMSVAAELASLSAFQSVAFGEGLLQIARQIAERSLATTSKTRANGVQS